MEIFKEIKGYENLYMVSNFGNILSVKNNKILKFDINKKNSTSYKRVTLSKEGKVKRFQVHRLVAEAFIDNIFNKPFVNHIDNNGLNNNVENLEWVTHSENMLHSSRQNRIPEGTNNLLKSAEILNKKSKLKFETIFGDRLIKIETINYRKFITFICSECNNTYTFRDDSPSIKRNGLCEKCFRKR